MMIIWNVLLFQSPYWLWLFVLPLILGMGYGYWSKHQLDRYCDLHLQSSVLLSSWSWRALPWQWLVMWMVCIIALAEPIWLSDQQRSEHQPITWSAVVDASESMLEQDIIPTRLQSVIWTLESLGQSWQQGDRASLAVFSGSAHHLIPSTQDQVLWQSALNLLSPDTLPLRGSLLVAAIKQIGVQEQAETRMIVFTDGGDLLDVDTSALLLPQHGVFVVVGTQQGQYPTDLYRIRTLAKTLGWDVIVLSDQGTSAVHAWLSEQRLAIPISSDQMMGVGTHLQSWLLALGLLIWAGFGRYPITFQSNRKIITTR